MSDFTSATPAGASRKGSAETPLYPSADRTPPAFEPRDASNCAMCQHARKFGYVVVPHTFQGFWHGRVARRAAA